MCGAQAGQDADGRRRGERPRERGRGRNAKRRACARDFADPGDALSLLSCADGEQRQHWKEAFGNRCPARFD